MIKSAAAILSCLFALSIGYYVSFWSYFDINAMQYIAVEDIIKGIVYPLRYGGAWILGLISFLVLLLCFVIGADQKKATEVTAMFRSLMYIFLFTSAGAFVPYALLRNSLAVGVVFSITVSLFVMALYLMLIAVASQGVAAKDIISVSDPKHPIASIANYILVYAVIFLFINAIITGQVEARKILAGLEFNYIMRQDLPEKAKTENPYLVFLGAISEKYIFIDRVGNERFVIDKDELPVLKVHHFDSSDQPSQKILLNCLLKAKHGK